MANRSAGPREVAAGFGAVVLVVLCCAGPALVGAGALAAVGGFFRNPLVVIAAAVLAIGSVVGVLRARKRPTR